MATSVRTDPDPAARHIERAIARRVEGIASPDVVEETHGERVRPPNVFVKPLADSLWPSASMARLALIFVVTRVTEVGCMDRRVRAL